MMIDKKYLLLMAVLIISYVNLYSQIGKQYHNNLLNDKVSPIITDRPDVTESALVLEHRNFQMETGISKQYLTVNGNNLTTVLFPDNLFRYGIMKNIELRVVNQHELYKDELNEKKQGIKDVEVGTKIQILNKSSIDTKIAFLSHIKMPTGSLFLSDKRWDWINKLLVSHEITESVSLGYNIGFLYSENNINRFSYSISLGTAVNNKVGVYVEPFGELMMNNFDVNVDSGFTYLIKNNMQLDFSFGTGITETMNYISLGFSWLLRHKQ